MKLCVRLAFAAVSTFCALNSSGAPPTSQPWDTAFTADTDAILNAANQVTAADDQPVIILLEDHRYVVENDGRVSGIERKVYRVQREDAVEDWSSIEQQYQPWRDRKPAIRARVISKNGSVHLLDQKTIADSPVADTDNSTFSDQRIARAPLPAVAAGSVIEYEISSDSSPAFTEAGVTRRVNVFDNVPLERFHLNISAPANAGLQTVSQQIPQDVIHRSADKQMVHVEFELGPLKPRKTVEYNLPFDASPWPYFGFTTARSWQAIAGKYGELVDSQIQGADLKPVMGSVDLTGDPVAVVARLTSELHRNIRYTGIEFGESAIVPTRPADVLQRRFGDCKDKSSLLVAMLRAAGLKANVALLRSGFGVDVDAGAPGIDLFDHAIVFVDIPQHPMWIDATASNIRIGEVPFADQGRLALIASRETAGLTKIPERYDAWESHTYEVRFKDFGPGSITEIIEASGPAEATLRAVYASGDDPKTALEKYVKSGYSAKALGKFEVVGGDDLSRPVRVSVEARETPQVVTNAEFAQIILGSERVFSGLPYSLLSAQRKTTEDKAPARTHDFILPSPAGMVNVYKLFPPAEYRIGNLPAPSEDKIGPLTFTRDYRTGADGEIDVEYRLEVPKRRLTGEEYEQIREGIDKFSANAQVTLNFVPATAELVAVGEFGKAVSMVKKDVEQHPENAGAHIRFSRLLVTAGLGRAARAEALKATEMEKDSSQAWQALAWSWQNDSFGRLREGDWDRTEALKDLRKAVELDPADNVAAADLGILLEYNNMGERYGKGADLDGAVRIYRDLLKKQAYPVLETNITADLFYLGQYDAAQEESAKCPETQRVAFSTAVLAIKQGAAKAIVSLQSAAPDPIQRAQLLAGTSLMLAHVRKYEEANVLMQAAQRASGSQQLSAMIQLLGHAKPAEEQLYPASDPRSVVQRVVLLLMQGDIGPETLKPLLSSKSKLIAISNEDVTEARASIAPMMRQLGAAGLTAENLVDLSLGQLTLEKRGDDAKGYRISQQNGPFPPMYVIKEDDGYKILGSADSAEDIGALVLDLLKKNDIAGAQWWLDQVAPDLKADHSGWLPAAKTIWSGLIPETRGPDVIRTAAAAMMGRYSASPEAVRILETSLKTAKTSIDKSQIDQALCEAFAKAARWADLLTASKRLMASKTFGDAGFYYLVRATEALGNWREMEAAGLERVKLDAKNSAAWRAIALARMRSENAAGADEAIAKLKELPGGSEAGKLAIWAKIFSGKVTAETISALKNPAAGAEKTADEYMAGLAAAIIGKTDQALDSLRAAIGNSQNGSLDARAWVLYGDICDQYGFKEAAAESWHRARTARNETDEARWTLATLK